MYTGKNSRKYTPCQLLYWYRSNELWKDRGFFRLLMKIQGSHTQTARDQAPEFLSTGAPRALVWNI